MASPAPPSLARIGTAALLAALLGACGTTDRADLRLAWLQTHKRGDVALGPSSGAAPAGSNSVRTLGVDDENPTLLVAGVVPTEFGRFGGSLFVVDDAGDGTLTSAFGDIAAGTAVSTRTDLKNLKAYWVYDVVRTENVRVAPGVALDFVDLELETRAANAPATFERVELFAPVPMLFLDGDVRFDRFLLALQGGWMDIDLPDGDGTYWDFEGRIGWVPHDDFEVFAGYRLLSIDADGAAGPRDAAVDLRIDGWFVGGAYRF